MMVQRPGVVWGAIAFGIALAVMIGVRLDQAALAVVVGVACGVGASIPTGLMVVFLLRRRDFKDERQSNWRRGNGMAQSPSVVVVAPPAVPQLGQPTAWPDAYGTPLPARRDFAVIGEEGMENGVDFCKE
jgi:hypothetical protein